MDLDTLINTIYQAKEDKEKEELIQDFIQTIEHSQSVVLSNLKRLFVLLSNLLLESDNTVVQHTNELILLLIDHILVSELEIQCKAIFKFLFQNLAHTSPVVRKQTKQIFIAYTNKTRNLESIIQAALSWGFNDANYYIRQRAINLFPKLLQRERSIFSSRSGVNDIRRLLENIILHLNDKVSSVREECQKVLVKISRLKFENFDNAFRRLSIEHQEQYNKVVDQNKKKIQADKFVAINLEDLQVDQDGGGDSGLILGQVLGSSGLSAEKGGQGEHHRDDSNHFLLNKEEVIKTYIQNEVPTEKEAIKFFFPKDAKGLYFDFLPESILLDSLNQNDIKVRTYAVQELNERFNQGGALNEAKKHLLKFFKYLCHLMKENCFQIDQIVLTIFTKVIDIPGVQVKAYLPMAIPYLIEKLGSEQYTQRQKVAFILRRYIRILRKNTLLNNFLLFLDPNMDNWHTKEEILHLICILFLEITEQDQWYHNAFSVENNNNNNQNNNNDMGNSNGSSIVPVNPVDNVRSKQNMFKDILFKIALHLDDKIQKVRHVSMETLAVICYGKFQKPLMQILHEIIHQQVFEELMDKLEKGRVYFINDKGNLELPIIDMKKLEEQKDDWDEKFQQYKQYLAKQQQEKEKEEQDKDDEDKDEELEEKKDNQTKLSLFYPEQNENQQYSQKQQLIRRNEEFERVLMNQYKGIDNITYDIVMPLKQEYEEDFQKDKFGKSIFMQDSVVAQQTEKRREEEMQTVNNLQKKLYYFKPKPDEGEDQKMEGAEGLQIGGGENNDEEYRPPLYQLQYQKQMPEWQNAQQRLQNVNINVSRRVNDTIKELNDRKGVLNLPLVVQANTNEYQGYVYEGGEKNNDGSGVGEEEEIGTIFLDTKKIKEEALKAQKEEKKMLSRAELIRQQREEQQQQNEKQEAQQKIQQIQHKQAKNQVSVQERYQYMIDEFLDHEENEQVLQREKNQKQAATFKRKKKKHQQSGASNEYTLEEQFEDQRMGVRFLQREQLPPLETPSADIKAATLNLRATQWQVQFNTITHLRQIIRNHWEVLYSKDISLKMLVDDISFCCDSLKFAVAKNALMCVNELAFALKSSLDPNIENLLAVCLRRALDSNQEVVELAKAALVTMSSCCHEGKVLNFLVTNWNPQSFMVKIAVAISMEKLVPKIGRNFNFYRDNYIALVKIIGEMLCDGNFQVRRVGKKVFFKLLSSEIDKQDLLRQCESLDHVLQTKLIQYMSLFKNINKDGVLNEANFNMNEEDNQYVNYLDMLKRPDSNNTRVQRPNSHLLKTNQRLDVL